MLSILIPIFNTDINPLVESIEKQINHRFDYEIIGIEDASDIKFSVPNSVQYLELPQNIGRSAIRNLLAEKAKYQWLLFLDADTLPVYKNFIEQYLFYIEQNTYKVVFGGLSYRNSDYQINNNLRFVYGKSRESRAAKQRNLKPHLSLLMSNTLVQKSVFGEVLFNEQIKKYGHEDAVFSYELFKKGINVLHIDNPVYHIGIEANDIFVEKTKVAIENLLNLYEKKIIFPEVNKLLQWFILLRKIGISKILAKTYHKGIFNFTTEKNDKNPSLVWFDICRLSYLCYLYHTNAMH